MSISIRPFLDTDLNSAKLILAAAFQRSGDWLNELSIYRLIQPDGYFMAWQEATPVGLVGSVIYPDYAYIGMMAVDPQVQRQGVGRLLMEHVLAWLDGKGIPRIELDASPQGQGLYEKLGFIPGKQVHVLQRLNHQPKPFCDDKVLPLDVPDLDRFVEKDAQIFGVNRGRVLRVLLDAYPDRGYVLTSEVGGISGYLLAQRSRIGSWVMQDPAGAGLLLQAALSLPFDSPPTTVVPAENSTAMELLQQYGFQTVRVNRHMTRGSAGSFGVREKVFAQASLSLG
jgi:ribosomal protein S18 acetylase RimI-like enzyme